MSRYAAILFLIDVIVLILLLAGICWSVAFPNRRVWPPPVKGSWQYRVTWFLFYLVFGLNALLIVLDWDSWLFGSPIRYLLGVPLMIVGLLMLVWGFRTLGARNTSGLKDGFITGGPYRFTRNPQYLGDMLLFLGLSVCANSAFVWTAHVLLILIFLITPLAEEDWLSDQYPEAYSQYRSETPRFL